MPRIPKRIGEGKSKRKFNGKTYTADSTHPDKKGAQEWGRKSIKKWGAKGYRVVPYRPHSGPTRYTLYIRK